LLADSDDDYNKDELEIIDPQLLIKDMAVSPAIFNIGDGDNDYVCKLMKLKLPDEFRHIPSYKYQFWQYAHMHQLIKTYYKAVEVAREI
jgi:hypothetical protein